MTRPTRSLWRSRRLPRLRAPLASPTLAHFCLGLQSLLCPLEGRRPEGVHAQAACWPLSICCPPPAPFS